MALIIKELYRNYFVYVEDARDLRINHFFLLGQPWKIICLLSFYLYFVKNLGPKLMKNRPPFDLKRILLIYNAIQVIANFTFGCMGIYMTAYAYSYDWSCILSDYSHTTKGYLESYLTYWYFLLKVFDLLDTIFFVLRKNNNQITFLHVYHHVVICFFGYIGCCYVPAGHSTLLGIINSFVHVIMYAYYFLTALNSIFKKSSWKKYITQIQLMQFIILVVHYLRPFFHQNCKASFFYITLALLQNLFMLTLFTDFYVKAYIKKPQQKIL